MPAEAGTDGVRLRLLASPRASRTAFGDVVTAPDGRKALKIKVAAPPVDGAANRSIIDYLAKTLALPKSAVEIDKGATGRLKTVRLSGAPEEIMARLSPYLVKA
ncbi:DUF167 domain-containing protein [Paracoccaceae bacterium GXU_MW_L88]